MYILGIIGYPGKESHDTSAALYHNGKIVVAAEQERFSRRKHAYGEFPYDAIKYCLEKEKIGIGDLNEIAISWEFEDVPSTLKGGVDTDVSLSFFPRSYFEYERIPPITFVDHHLTHLTSAFYQSGYKEAACLIIDGQGQHESITMAYANGSDIKILKKFPICYSLGAFYDAAAGYTGLGFDVPGKLMGLSSYGKCNQKMPIDFDDTKGKFVVELSKVDEKDTGFISVRNKYIEYFKKNNYPYKIAPFARVETGELMSYADFAASVQNCLGNIVCKLGNYLKKLTGSNNLVMAGGVALNCTSNGMLDSKNLFKNIFIYPAANDAGGSVGAALEIARRSGEFDSTVPNQINNIYLGKYYTNEEYARILKNHSLCIEYIVEEDFADFVAELLLEGKVIAWFQDGFEFGPRALGARSILANPTDREMLNIVNKVKHRELWRPLSPIIIDKYYKDVFEDKNENNLTSYMLKTCKIREEWMNRIPAVVHVDGTSRPQRLRREANKKLYLVLEKFFQKTGIPLLINTSFNIKRQPIVNTPLDAIISLEHNLNIDALMMGNWYIRRPNGYVLDVSK